MIPRVDERPNTVRLQWQDSKYEEGRAAADTTIYPGMALELTDDESGISQFPPGVTPSSGAVSVLRIAVESLLGGVGNVVEGRDIADPYLGGDSEVITDPVEAFLAGELVPYIIPRSGDVFGARVAADGDFTIGEALKLHTDGTFVAQGGTGTIVAVAEETHDFGDDDPPVTPLLRARAV
jgi:hypothetical protein